MNKKMGIIIGVAVGIALIVAGYFLTRTEAPSPVTEAPKPETGVETVPSEAKNMIIETQYGTIEAEFYPNDAPKTVARIQELVKQGFYNGLTFHRVVPGFVVQGGDPDGTGGGGSGKKLMAEFNSRKHVEGTLAMARTSDPNSADSQWYIALGTIPHLDGQYTVFGQVTKGMEFVKQIKQGDKMTSVTLK